MFNFTNYIKSFNDK